MLLQQVLEELSPNHNSTTSAHEEEEEEEEDDDEEKQKEATPNPARTLDVKRSAPLTRHTVTTNAHYLYRAAIAAKEIQSSAGHGRLSAPALLANCLLSMISLTDNDDDELAADKIEGDPAAAAPPMDGRNTILKSFSQLHEEERKRKESMMMSHSLHGSNHKRLEIISCCLFPCKRNISSKSMGSTLELLHNSDELSSSNDDSNSRSRVRVTGGGRSNSGAWAPCNLRSFMKRVLCKGSSEASAGSSIGDHDMIYDDDHHGLSAWAGTSISTHENRVNQDDDHNVDHHYYEYMYNNGHSLLHVGNAGGFVGVLATKADAQGRGACAGAVGAYSETCGSCTIEAQEVVHEVNSSPSSHDAPVASSFVFEQSCFSSSSSTSSTSHCMKLERVHPWLISRDSCTTSPLHDDVPSYTNPNIDPPPNHALLVMQDDLHLRLANKRLNLSR